MRRARGVQPTRWLMAALAVGLAACGEGPGDTGPQEEPGPVLRLEVGTGRRFTPLAEGATLRLQRGCQGGQHVFVSLRAWGLPPAPAMVELALTRTGDDLRVSLPYRVRLPFTEGEGVEAPVELDGLLLVVPEADEAVGSGVRLSASVESGAGARASDARSGTLQWGPDACP